MTVLRKAFLSGALLLAGLSGTAVAVYCTWLAGAAKANRELVFFSDELQDRLQDRVRAHEQILRSGAAFLVASDRVTREEWHRFADHQKIEQNLPGIQGLGFALLIPRQKLAQHVREIQSEGFPAYQVYPAGEREVYSAIIYLEPFTNRNLRAFGYDMLSEPVRREAMERACDQNTGGLSGKVRLVQETDKDVQPGALMYVPVYRPGLPCETVAQRRAALLGWVYSPYRMNDLMQGILGGWGLANSQRIRLEIFDGGQASSQALLYDSYPNGGPCGAASSALVQRQVFSAGRSWLLHFTWASCQSYAGDYGRVWLVLLAGASTSLLLFWLLLNLLNTRTAWKKTCRLAAELRASEEKHRQLVENSPVIIYTMARDGAFTFVSPSWAVVLGHPVAHVVGRRFQDFVHPDDHAACLGWMQHMAETGQRKDGVGYRIKHADGTWRWHNTNAVPLRDVDGTISGFEGIAIDITASKRAEAMLQESESRFDQLAEQSGMFVWEVDAQGRYTYVSHVVEAVLGYRPDELVGRIFFYELHPEAGREAFTRASLAAFERKESFCNLINAAVTKEGRLCWLSTTGHPLLNGDGSLRGFRGSDTEVTDRKRLEDSLRKIEERLKQTEKMEALGQLAGGVAHDFNNVLCGIIGFADMSLEYSQQDSVLGENLRQILKAADRAKKLVKQILTFSRKNGTQKTATAVCPVVEEALDLLRASTPSSVIIEADLNKGAKPVLADSSKLHELILNLAANAVHAMERKGTLTVRLYAEDLARPASGWIGEIAPGGYTVIEVADTGCGMDEATLAKAFEPFFTTKAVGEGTGMGLSVVLGVVQSHGGDIQVESKVGKGTTFKIYLPVTGTPEATAAGGVAVGCRGGTETILFVDDEPMLVGMGRTLLSGLGYTVIALSDSLAALETIKAKGSEIDLLVTDQTMPGLTGIELAKEALAIRSDFPVILCTGFSNEVNPQRVAAIGIRHFMMKPFLPHELGAAIREILDRAQASS
jgi:PAS domain S-box-containing protein